MVYETDFYTSRRPYRASPSLSTYTVTSTPAPSRYYTVRDSPERSRRSESSYSYSSTSERSTNSSDPYSYRPSTRSYSTSESVNRTSGSGPGGYSYSSDRTSRSTGDGPGGYSSSHSSVSSGRLPGGTSYRHYSYRSEPSRQVRILPGLGKVHVVHSYDRIIPYIGHKRLTVVTQPPTSIVRVRPSTLYREFDRIENKLRPYTYNSYTNDYLNSESHVRITYVRNPITGSLPVYRPSTLYTSRYYDPYYPSYYTSYYPSYYPSYLNTSYYTSYLPTLYPTTRRYYTSPLNLYPSERWLDLSLYPSWRHNHFARMFDDETRAIRAQINSLSNQVHSHVPRKLRSMPLPYATSRYEDLPARWSNDNYVHKMVCSTPSNSAEYVTYWSDPVRRQFCNGRLACVSIVGAKMHPRRKNIYVYHDDPVRNDIQLLSYYINRFREERNTKKPISVRVILPPLRPSRVFSVPRPLEDAHMDTEEVSQMKQERAARLAKLAEVNPADVPKIDVKAKLAEEKAKREATLPGAAKKAAAKKREEEAAAEEEEKKKKAAEEAAAEAKKAAEAEAAKKAAEEAAAKQAADKAAEEAKAKEEAAKKEKEAKEAAAKAAELERLAEQAKQEELAKQAEIEKAKKEEEERARLEEEKRLAEAAKAEEERQQLLRLEEIARQAEEEKEAELARQAEELAELARQEAELAEQAKAEEEAAEQQRKDAEAAELALKEAELAELETKEKELTEQAEAARAEADAVAAEVEASEPIVEEPESPVPAEEAPAAEEDAIEEPTSGTEEE